MKLWVITVARKPLDGTVADNVQKWGTGGINIDGARIKTADKLGGGGEKHNDFQGKPGWDRPWMHDPAMQEAAAERKRASVARSEALGRWPANLILQHKPGCRMVGQKRVKPVGGSGRTGEGAHGFQTSYVGGEKKAEGFTGSYVDDSGLETVDNWECVEGCPVTDLGEQSGCVQYGSREGGYSYLEKNYQVEGFLPNCQPNSPSNYGDSGTAARFFKQVKDDAESDS